MKLLIIDDNESIRNMLKDILATKFEEIYEHFDGQGATEIFAMYKPDFVLMDIKMKEIDGITATRNIIAKYPNAKVIVISQHSDQGIINESYQAGALKFIKKENLTELIKFFE